MATSNFEQFTLESFDTNEITTAGYRWMKYLTRFNDMVQVHKILDNKRQKVGRHHHPGEDVFNIYCKCKDC